MQAWQISSKWEKKCISIIWETDQSFKYRATNTSNRTRWGRPRQPPRMDRGEMLQSPGGCATIAGLSLRFTHSHGGRKWAQVAGQGPARFSHLAVNARAQRPWKHAQTSFPLQVPVPLRFPAKVLNNLAGPKWHSPTQLCCKQRQIYKCPSNQRTCHWSWHQWGCQPGSRQSGSLWERTQYTWVESQWPCLCHVSQPCTQATADWLNSEHLTYSRPIRNFPGNFWHKTREKPQSSSDVKTERLSSSHISHHGQEVDLWKWKRHKAKRHNRRVLWF